MYIKDGVTWFEIGDRVELLVDYPDGNDDLVRGSMGCVTEDQGDDVESPDAWISVCWDKEISGGHDTGHPDRCPSGHGWNVDRTALAFIPSFDDRDTEYDLESEQELMSMLGVSI